MDQLLRTSLTQKISNFPLSLVAVLSIMLLLGLSVSPNADAQYGTWLHPFSATSIWNTPIDWTTHTTTSAHIPQATYATVDQEWFETTTSSDGPYDVQQGTYGGYDRGLMYMPSTFYYNHLAHFDTNGIVVSLEPDGVTYGQISQTFIDPPTHQDGTPWNTSHIILGYRGDDDLITGDGIHTPAQVTGGNSYRGVHFGSGLSGLAGALRWEEMSDPSATIEHALQIEISNSLLNFNPNSATPGFIFPAYNADDTASTAYLGTNPRLVMGAWLAINPNVKLTMETIQGAKILYALKKYGGYIVDTTSGSGYQFGADHQVYDHLVSKYGQFFNQPDPITGATNPWYRDLTKIFNSLASVNTNTPSAPPVGQSISLLADGDGQYVVYDQSTSNDYIRGVGSQAQSSAQFKVVSAGGGYIALLASNGLYVTCDTSDNDRLKATKPSPSTSNEMFQWSLAANGLISLKSKATGFFVTCDLNDNDNLEAAFATNVKMWELYTKR